MSPTHSFDDDRAARVLTAFAEAHREGLDLALQPDQEILSALRAELGGAGVVAASVSEGELARAAVELLSDHVEHGPPIRALLEGGEPEAMSVVETAAVISAVLVVLQTHIQFERLPTGQWALRVEKQPTRSELLEKLVSKLLGFLGHG